MIFFVRPLGLLGPAPPGGTGSLPGIVLCALGLVGLLALPAEIKKFKRREAGLAELVLVVAADVLFMIAGLLMLAKIF